MSPELRPSLWLVRAHRFETNERAAEAASANFFANSAGIPVPSGPVLSLFVLLFLELGDK